MTTKNLLTQPPPVPMAPTDDVNQGFYGYILTTQTLYVGAFCYTNSWDEILFGPPITVTTQQGMPGSQVQSQERHLETVCLDTSRAHI